MEVLCIHPNTYFGDCIPEVSCVAAAGSAKGSGAADEAGDGEAAEEDEPKAELQLGDDSTLLFKEPAKLYFQGKDGVRGPSSDQIVAVPQPGVCSKAMHCHCTV